ncbi:MAG: PD40 domain-containing protein [Acidobacteria bacterium]|nr:PD40 domain-containing protein [Acidobacteriota bacterium]
MKINFLKATLVNLALLSIPLAADSQNFGPWQSPSNLGSVINSPCNEMHPTISKDSLNLIFSSNRPFDHKPASAADCLPALHLWGSQRAAVNDSWSAPRPLPINMPSTSTYEDHAPNLSTDGHWLIFHSQRPGDSDNPSCNGGGYRELWASHRHDSGDVLDWETPINLGCTLNAPFADDAGPNIWQDPATGLINLYFTRDLTPLGPGTDTAGNGFDVYVSTCTADISSCIRRNLWNAAAFEANLSSPARDTRTGIRRRDGLEMLITTNRAGSVGNLDLWVATKATAQDAWSTPIDLNLDNTNKGGAALPDTTSNDGGAVLSWDGETMFFYSNRAGGQGGNDLYITARRKHHCAR